MVHVSELEGKESSSKAAQSLWKENQAAGKGLDYKKQRSILVYCIPLAFVDSL